nr:hypothetical protein GCM10020092_040830 [Actinoplanes digitatis]
MGGEEFEVDAEAGGVGGGEGVYGAGEVLVVEAGEGFVAADQAVVELDDGLEGELDGTVVEHATEHLFGGGGERLGVHVVTVRRRPQDQLQRQSNQEQCCATGDSHCFSVGPSTVFTSSLVLTAPTKPASSALA